MLNPVLFTEKVVGDFLRYLLTAHPFSDPALYEQLRRLLNLEHTRNSPMLKGPYVSLSRPFTRGATIEELAAAGFLHPHLRELSPIQRLYGHQEKAIRSLAAGRSTLISTGTGSGKTECFLYPIISRCLQLRDQKASAGIVAVLVYPMNALAEDQLERMRELLAGSGVTFGLYIGKTPETEAEVDGQRMRAGESGADYRKRAERRHRDGKAYAIHPVEERCSRELMRRPGEQPRILLTNVKQLELLLTRGKDAELFGGARLDYLVFDEAHTFKGAQGAETACLIRRLRSFCGRTPEQTACIATSATMMDPVGGMEAARDFAARFFGVPRERVDLVSEVYEEDTWGEPRALPAPFTGDPGVVLRDVLAALGQEDDAAVAARLCEVLRVAAGIELSQADWRDGLHAILSRNELLRLAVEELRRPGLLVDVCAHLTKRAGRPVLPEDVLVWLALGAAARADGRPLVRPVIHVFVRGLAGAVVTFPQAQKGPRLWLSADDAAAERGANEEPYVTLPVITCTTCGQHYFTHEVQDFRFSDAEPGGGQARDNNVIWPPLGRSNGGKRLVLVDRLVADDGEGGEGGESAPKKSAVVHLCRHCGMLHREATNACLGCGRPGSLVQLFALPQKAEREGYLSRCLGCGAVGRQRTDGYREPARPVRAVAVSDVHVLAQNMVHYADRKRLLVFTDNRQDAAFQAGWMQDHARRFRLRSFMYERLRGETVHVGDLVAHLEAVLDADDGLSRFLIPEVWNVYTKESAPVKHADERRYFLRILVLREIATGARQRLGLEPWGRLRVEYAGLDAGLPFFKTWSEELGLEPAVLLQGVAALLDATRRKMILYDPAGKIFTKIWHESEFEIQRGFMPELPGVPRGLKLTRAPGDDDSRVDQWLTGRGTSVARQCAAKWGVRPDRVGTFLDALWKMLTVDTKLLVEVRLEGPSPKRRHLPNCQGACQLDSDKFLLSAGEGVYRCSTCRRGHARPTPGMKCMGFRCEGRIRREDENPDDYNLTVLDAKFEVLRPREHSAQVPESEREILARAFKGESELVNTLVCTPTLELGVDIGGLDSTLLRNVPPLPANYWQRVGRAGRRHRMAVNLTYARTASHDRAYFNNPARLLEGIIAPPRFNLRNEVLVRKHLHACVLTLLHELVRESSGLSADEVAEISACLAECFPRTVRDYLYDEEGNVRQEPRSVAALAALLRKYEERLVGRLRETLAASWPAEDADVVSDAKIRDGLLHMSDDLQEVTRRLWKRLQWALNQMHVLDDLRQRRGSLDENDKATYRRCERLMDRLKGTAMRRRAEAEGYDDTNTYAVLAAEGFLPGYGLEGGSVQGTAQMPRGVAGPPEYLLPRPAALALREYIPGNLIYANGHKFVPRSYQLEAVDPVTLRIDVTRETATPCPSTNTTTAGGMGQALLKAVPICDVDMPHRSHINDEEDYRFQVGSLIVGYELGRHSGGRVFRWGDQDILFRRALGLRLVNVGVTSVIRADHGLGYPVCLVTGQSRSPLATQGELDKFRQDHQERYGKPVENVGFYADVHADSLTFRDCADRRTAYSLGEALRNAAALILDMEIEDIQILCIAHAADSTVDLVMFDPMPGGSGLLEQMLAAWPELVDRARQFVAQCPAQCPAACVDCLLTFRNAHYHAHLDRQCAGKVLAGRPGQLQPTHEIPAVNPTATKSDEEEPVNAGESKLRDMLTRAGFANPEAQRGIPLGAGMGETRPDFFYPECGPFDGVCLYLDGYSRHIHGNPATRARDIRIREYLRNNQYEVIEITRTQLDDPQKMATVFGRLGRVLLGREQSDAIRQRVQEWHPAAKAAVQQPHTTPALPFRRVEPRPEDRYRTCLPLMSLQAAAGEFGAVQEVQPEAWVEVNGRHKLREGMFVAQVVGKSMEPRIPDGAHCLFDTQVAGSRQGKLVLVQLSDVTDPEHGGRYTVKQYESRAVTAQDGTWHHAEITLRALNKECRSIPLTAVQEDDVRVVAEVIEVLGRMA